MGHRIPHEPPYQRVDVTIERGREEQALGRRRSLGEQRRDVGQETHVRHLVGLVEHRDAHRVE
jgi:hypothetical protein